MTKRVQISDVVDIKDEQREEEEARKKRIAADKEMENKFWKQTFNKNRTFLGTERKTYSVLMFICIITYLVAWSIEYFAKELISNILADPTCMNQSDYIGTPRAKLLEAACTHRYRDMLVADEIIDHCVGAKNACLWVGVIAMVFAYAPSRKQKQSPKAHAD